MRCYLIVGADHVEGLFKRLRQMHDCAKVIRWNGRVRGKLLNKLPDVHAVYILTGFIQHAWAMRVRDLAKKQGILVYFLTRGRSSQAVSSSQTGVRTRT